MNNCCKKTTLLLLPESAKWWSRSTPRSVLGFHLWCHHSWYLQVWPDERKKSTIILSFNLHHSFFYFPNKSIYSDSHVNKEITTRWCQSSNVCFGNKLSWTPTISASSWWNLIEWHQVFSFKQLSSLGKPESVGVEGCGLKSWMISHVMTTVDAYVCLVPKQHSFMTSVNLLSPALRHIWPQLNKAVFLQSKAGLWGPSSDLLESCNYYFK